MVPSTEPLDTIVATARLSRSQIGIVVSWGLVAWLAAALVIRRGAELFGGGPATLATFTVGAVLAWPLVWATERVAGLRADQLVVRIALASAAAMLADGVGLVWSPLYATGGAAPLGAAAWLLWGVAWLLITAFMRSSD